jgi:hypothetical protein
MEGITLPHGLKAHFGGYDFGHLHGPPIRD